MTKRQLMSSERKVWPHSDLYHGADIFLTAARTQPEGSYYTTMAALLLTAFTFEAYLNHLGESVLKLWSPSDRRPVMKKYSTLCNHLGLVPNISRRPYQTLENLFLFRNAMAHARSTILNEQKVIGARDDPWKHRPQTAAERYCTLDNAAKAHADIEKAARRLNLAAGQGPKPFLFGPNTFVLTDIATKATKEAKP